MIEFLLKTSELKDEKRTGFQLYGIEEPESVAGHSWSTAFLTMIYGEEADIELERALKMAIIHDLAEAETGDLPHRVDDEAEKVPKEEKRRRELDFWEKFEDQLQDTDIIEIWKDYDRRETPEARFVKDMDLIDMVLQALKYEIQERYDPEERDSYHYDSLDEFFESALPRLNTDRGTKLFEEIENRYEKAKHD